MKKNMVKKDFDFYIDEYMYNCQSRRLRPKTMNSYEQTLRLFERWVRELEGIEHPADIREQTIRHYLCDLQERGKYSFYANDECAYTNYPDRRRDYSLGYKVLTVGIVFIHTIMRVGLLSATTPSKHLRGQGYTFVPS